MADNEHKKTIEEVMGEYAKTHEGQSLANAPKVSPAEKVPSQAPTTLGEMAENAVANRPTLKEAQEARREEILEEQHSIGQGYMEIPLKDLPSGGVFYPDGTKIFVRAASGADIRHWSMMNETDISQIDEALNYVIERCVTISFPTAYGRASWQDLKEIDRFYLIIAVRDFTFTEGHNELKIVVSETEDVIVKKDNITFIDLPEGIWKYYNQEKRCFTFDSTTPSIGQINIYMPCVGVTQWLKGYLERKTRVQEAYDKDFLTVAPMLIKDYHGLNDKKYGELILQTLSYSVDDWSLISHIRSVLERAVTPKFVYTDEKGVENETPLNFRGGIKSLFLNADLGPKLGF